MKTNQKIQAVANFIQFFQLCGAVTSVTILRAAFLSPNKNKKNIKKKKLISSDIEKI